LPADRQVALIHIDVESHLAKDVLVGARATLEKWRPVIIETFGRKLERLDDWANPNMYWIIGDVDDNLFSADHE